MRILCLSVAVLFVILSSVRVRAEVILPFCNTYEVVLGTLGLKDQDGRVVREFTKEFDLPDGTLVWIWSKGLSGQTSRTSCAERPQKFLDVVPQPSIRRPSR